MELALNIQGRIAISYSRFSSKKQEQTDSLRRQRETFEKACEQHGFVEYEDYKPLIDKAKSGFTGENTGVYSDDGKGSKAQVKNSNVNKRADLEGFIHALETGKLTFPEMPVLVVEKWDRIGRLKGRLTRRLLDVLLEHVDIFDCSDNQLIQLDIEDDFGADIQLRVKIHAAHLYSKQLSERVGEAKRQQLLDSYEKGIALPNGNLPKWLKLCGIKPNYHYEVIEHRAEVIRDIFRLYNAGMGVGAIARKFDSEQVNGWDRWGKDTVGKWHAPRVSALLRSKSTCGYHVSRTVKKDLTEFKTYSNKNTNQGLELKIFPEIVSETTWQIAAAKKEILPLHKRKNNHQKQGNNILQGLLFCSRCNAKYLYRMRRTTKEALPQVSCGTRDIGGSCKNSSVYYALIEQAVLGLVFDKNNIAHLLQDKSEQNNEQEVLLSAKKSKILAEIDMFNEEIESQGDDISARLYIGLSRAEKALKDIDIDISKLVTPETENVDLAEQYYSDIKMATLEQRLFIQQFLTGVIEKVEIESIRRGKKIITVELKEQYSSTRIIAVANGNRLPDESYDMELITGTLHH